MSHAETGLKDVLSKVWSLIWFKYCHKATEIKEPFKPSVCEFWPLQLPNYRTDNKYCMENRMQANHVWARL